MKKLQINNTFDRKKLSEGRNYGVGFTILKKIDNFTFNTLLSFTACKDYLNDIVYKTFYNTDIEFKAYGYIAKSMTCYKHKKFFYFGVKMLDYNNGKEWLKKEEANLLLINNISNLITIINKYEQYINLSNYKTTLYKKNNNVIVLKCPIFWVKKTYLISLLSLIIRLFFNVDKKDVNKSLVVLSKKHIPFIPADKYNMVYLTNFLNLKLSKNTLKIVYPCSKLKSKDHLTIHNAGISNFVFNNNRT